MLIDKFIILHMGFIGAKVTVARSKPTHRSNVDDHRSYLEHIAAHYPQRKSAFIMEARFKSSRL